MLHLIKMWLKAPVEETDERGKKHRNTGNRDQGKGTPQGSPISPLLSNLYMRRFVLGWKKLGHEKRFGACIVNYADDMVICCRGRAEEALTAMRVMMTKLKLKVNETKTRVAKLPEEKFDFLGYTFGRYYSPMTGRAHLGSAPSKKRVIRICRAISDETKRSRTQLDHETVVRKLNQMMIGWANYFCLGSASKAYRAIEQHADKRLRQWLCIKHKVSWPATGNFPRPAFTIRLVLSGSRSGRAAFRERRRDVSSGSRMREICMSGSMSGMWKRSTVRIMRHRQTKGPGTDRDLTHRATSRLYPVLRFLGYFRIAGDSTTIPTSDFKNGVDGGATHLPSWQLLERTTALGDDERDVIELGAGGELLDLFHNRSD